MKRLHGAANRLNAAVAVARNGLIAPEHRTISRMVYGRCDWRRAMNSDSSLKMQTNFPLTIFGRVAVVPHRLSRQNALHPSIATAVSVGFDLNVGCVPAWVVLILLRLGAIGHRGPCLKRTILCRRAENSISVICRNF
jgi:hypothetical protein